MSETKAQTNEARSFDAIKIGLASPERIREWSRGEVKTAETINYRTHKPEIGGLFCEKIFGPSKDWECHCGRYKKQRFKKIVCEVCGVEVTKANVRRERMGHIELAAPVSHIWYFKGIPSRMGLILDLSPKVLEKILYFVSYIVLDPGETTLQYKQVLSQEEYMNAKENFGDKAFRAGMGAEAIEELLKAIDLETESESLKSQLAEATGQKKGRLAKRLEVIEAFRESGNRPEWMVLRAIPVIPPDLRPMVPLDGGRFAVSDLNDLYRHIIERNNRVRKLLDDSATPEIIMYNEKRMLQEAVDALIDNGRRGRAITGSGNRPLKSLSDMLKGKSGRFRQNLLGKRVDYSGRSVIVVEPKLKIYQCGLPKEMAIELFKPFVMKELVQNGTAHNVKNAKKMVEHLEPSVWDVLEDVIKEHPVMLNRAPTLHRLGIQAFEPILVEGKAIKLHPLVCTAFNADFDGDQMAAHLPLSQEAQAECRFMLLSPNNLLKPSDGGPVAVPSQDMVLGIYYLTMDRVPDYTGKDVACVNDTVYDAEAVDKALADGKLKPSDMIHFQTHDEVEREVICTVTDVKGHAFSNANQAILAYDNKEVSLHQKVRVRREVTIPETGEVVTGIVDTTVGKIIFNEIIPQDLGFVKREKPEDYIKYEIDFHVAKKHLKKILEKVISTHGATRTAEVLDDIKAMGYKFSTRAAMTVSISDMTVPAAKPELLEKAQETVDSIEKNYRRGLVTERERYKEVIETWKQTDDQLTELLINGLDKYNNIFMMADSGARGSNQQIKQLAGMRGLMADTQGNTIELPIKSNFREGLDVLEYFMSAHGARKGLSDTALRTADSGYLTRRLVDISQHLIVREGDCVKDTGREIPGTYVSAFMEGKETIESLRDRILGRFAAESVFDKDGNMLVKINHLITPKRADDILAKGVDPESGEPITRVKIRNILNCRSRMGVCAKCYGTNLATGQSVQVGEAIGIIAAQSIGEPGTQLTMRTFHTGGVAGNDITQGLPRVEEIFEARKPKGVAVVSEISGVATHKFTGKKREIVITNPEDGDTRTYLINFNSSIKVLDGAVIKAGDPLTDGNINPHDILDILGIKALQDYMLSEVQKVYRLQGVDINDKHIEVIVRQMLRKIRVDDEGESKFLPGTMVDALDFEETNEALEAEGKNPAIGTRQLLPVTKAALATNSFLSAASFQETTKVLTEAAIKGKIDPLIGMKENVIIGKPIPAGTGMKHYRNVSLDTDAITQEFAAADFFDGDDDDTMPDVYDDAKFEEEIPVETE